MATLKLSEVLLNVKSAEWMKAQKGEVLNSLSLYADKLSKSGKTKEATTIHTALKKEYGRREKLDAVKESVGAQVKSKTLKKTTPAAKVDPPKQGVKKAQEVVTKLTVGTKLEMKDSEGNDKLVYSVRAVVDIGGKENYLCVDINDDRDYIVGRKHAKKNALITPRGWEEPYKIVK